MCVVASSNGGNCCFIGNCTFQILRLVSLTSPSASAGTVVAKGAADAIIITSTGEQGVKLLYSRLGAAQPQLQSPTHGWQQIVAL